MTGDEKCGCPYCSNQKLLSGYNDLLTAFPEIAQEWDYEGNVDLSPNMVLAGTHKKVLWVCKKEHRWQASIDSRTGRNIGCPICANRVVWKGFNDLQTIYPNIAKEWNNFKVFKRTKLVKNVKEDMDAREIVFSDALYKNLVYGFSKYQQDVELVEKHYYRMAILKDIREYDEYEDDDFDDDEDYDDGDDDEK